MRKNTFLVLTALLFCFMFSAFNQETEFKNEMASVNQIEGLYVFTDSEPLAETEYLGTVKNIISLGSPQYTNIRDKLVRKAKKDFPDCDAVILRFTTGGSDKADAVKFTSE